MDVVFHGLMIGIVASTIVGWPLLWIGAKVIKHSAVCAQIPGKTWDSIGIVLLGLLVGLASVIGSYQNAIDKQAHLTWGHIFMIEIALVLMWVFAAFGTGKLESDSPEDEQLRERRTIAIVAIIGSSTGLVISGVYFLVWQLTL